MCATGTEISTEVRVSFVIQCHNNNINRACAACSSIPYETSKIRGSCSAQGGFLGLGGAAGRAEATRHNANVIPSMTIRCDHEGEADADVRHWASIYITARRPFLTYSLEW